MARRASSRARRKARKRQRRGRTASNRKVRCYGSPFKCHGEVWSSWKFRLLMGETTRMPDHAFAMRYHMRRTPRS